MKIKWKKTSLIIAGLFVIIGIIVVAFKNYKEIEAHNKEQLRTDYFFQNTAFCASNTPNAQYASYSTLDIHYLQAYLNYYYETTGIDITLSDVEEFLKEQYNKDGTPKTYKDDDGLLYNYVKYYNNHYTSFLGYWDALAAILVQYIRENPECPYISVKDLSLDSINKLSKKHQDEEYQLILE